MIRLLPWLSSRVIRVLVMRIDARGAEATLARLVEIITIFDLIIRSVIVIRRTRQKEGRNYSSSSKRSCGVNLLFGTPVTLSYRIRGR